MNEELIKALETRGLNESRVRENFRLAFQAVFVL